MPEPLPSDVVARLRSDSTAALAAALILATSFPDLMLWAVRVFSGEYDVPNGAPKANGAGGSNGAAQSDGPPAPRISPPAPRADIRRERPPPIMTGRCWR